MCKDTCTNVISSDPCSHIIILVVQALTSPAPWLCRLPWLAWWVFSWPFPPHGCVSQQVSWELLRLSRVLLWWLSGKESACNAEDWGFIPGSGRSPGEGNGNPFQYSCLGNPMDRGVWWATVHGVAKSWSDWATNTFTSLVKGVLVQVSSVTQSCLTLCDPMNHSTPGFPVHHQLPESTQTHVHCVGDAIQTSHPLSSPSPPTFSLSQHQGFFKWVSPSHQVAKVLEFQLQHQSLQWAPRTDLL